MLFDQMYTNPLLVFVNVDVEVLAVLCLVYSLAVIEDAGHLTIINLVDSSLCHCASLITFLALLQVLRVLSSSIYCLNRNFKLLITK